MCDRVSFRRVLVAAISAAILTLALAGTTSAHISIVPAQVPPETNQAFAMRVPNEKAEPTVKVRVEFPEGITISRFRPVPGWTRQVERDGQQRIVAVEWAGGQVADGEYQDFEFIARTSRDSGKLAFKAYQTYQSGETVAWANPEGQDQPAAILIVGGAPVLASGGSIEGAGAVQASSTTGGSAAALATQVPSTSASAATSQPAARDQTAGGSDLPLFTAILAAILGAVAIVLAGLALARRPRQA